MDKIPNLAGLARTCEVLGAEALALADARAFVSRRDFTSISVTAERWLPVRQVPIDGLGAYLERLRREGYALVGLEQTRGAVSLDDFEWAPKTALVLGREREGVDADVLAALDECVVIPQRAHSIAQRARVRVDSHRVVREAGGATRRRLVATEGVLVARRSRPDGCPIPAEGVPLIALCSPSDVGARASRTFSRANFSRGPSQLVSVRARLVGRGSLRGAHGPARGRMSRVSVAPPRAFVSRVSSRVSGGRRGVRAMGGGSGASTTIEVERKFSLDVSVDELRARVESCGGREQGNVEFTDTYYDTPGASSPRATCGCARATTRGRSSSRCRATSADRAASEACSARWRDPRRPSASSSPSSTTRPRLKIQHRAKTTTPPPLTPPYATPWRLARFDLSRLSLPVAPSFDWTTPSSTSTPPPSATSSSRWKCSAPPRRRFPPRRLRCATSPDASDSARWNTPGETRDVHPTKSPRAPRSARRRGLPRALIETPRDYPYIHICGTDEGDEDTEADASRAVVARSEACELPRCISRVDYSYFDSTRYTPSRYTPSRYTPPRYTPSRYTPSRRTST